MDEPCAGGITSFNVIIACAGARATAGIIGLNIVLFGVDCSLPVNASRLIDCLAFHENDGLYPDCDRFNYAGVVCSLTGTARAMRNQYQT